MHSFRNIHIHKQYMRATNYYFFIKIVHLNNVLHYRHIIFFFKWLFTMFYLMLRFSNKNNIHNTVYCPIKPVVALTSTPYVLVLVWWYNSHYFLHAFSSSGLGWPACLPSGYNLTSISSCSLVIPLFCDFNVGYTFCVQPNKGRQSDGLYHCLHW